MSILPYSTTYKWNFSASLYLHSLGRATVASDLQSEIDRCVMLHVFTLHLIFGICCKQIATLVCQFHLLSEWQGVQVKGSARGLFHFTNGKMTKAKTHRK